MSDGAQRNSGVKDLVFSDEFQMVSSHPKGTHTLLQTTEFMHPYKHQHRFFQIFLVVVSMNQVAF